MVMNDMTDDGKAVLQPIDWNAPIEALYEGKWVPVQVAEHDTCKETQYPYRLEYGPFTDQWFTADGKHCISSETIRNVQPATQAQTQTLTAQERLARMEALCRALSDVPRDSVLGQSGYASEARALVAEMEPVDPDLIEARRMVADQYGNSSNVSHLVASALSGDGDEWFHTKVALAAIRRGRELARGDVA